MEIGSNLPEQNEIKQNVSENKPSQEILGFPHKKETKIKKIKKSGEKKRAGKKLISVMRKKRKTSGRKKNKQAGKRRKKKRGAGKKKKQKSKEILDTSSLQQPAPQVMQKTMPLNRLQLYMARLRN